MNKIKKYFYYFSIIFISSSNAETTFNSQNMFRSQNISFTISIAHPNGNNIQHIEASFDSWGGKIRNNIINARLLELSNELEDYVNKNNNECGFYFLKVGNFSGSGTFKLVKNKSGYPESLINFDNAQSIAEQLQLPKDWRSLCF